VLLAAVRGEREHAQATWRSIREELARDAAAVWEHDWLAALDTPHASAEARVALVNEQLRELDYRAQRWARVPRVCASVSTSVGFLLASVAMRNALAADAIDVDAAVVGAIDVAAVGLAGAVFCVACQLRARSLARRRLEAMDKWVERVESLTG
jgi:hypothetical protein